MIALICFLLYLIMGIAVAIFSAYNFKLNCSSYCQEPLPDFDEYGPNINKFKTVGELIHATVTYCNGGYLALMSLLWPLWSILMSYVIGYQLTVKHINKKVKQSEKIKNFFSIKLPGDDE